MGVKVMNTLQTLSGVFFSLGILFHLAHASPASLPSTTPVPACSMGQSNNEGLVLPKGLLEKEVCNVYPHEGCETTDTCDLVEIGFWVKHFTREVKKTNGKEPESGTMLYAWYQTKSLETLEKYVFVQYVRGCAYFVMYSEGEVNAYFNKIEHGGMRNSVFCFPEWEIDMITRDPVYTSEGVHRHKFAQWTNIPRQFPSKYAKEYGEEKPVFPILGMIDSPDRAFVRKWGNGRVLAYNSALEFRTCLYRAEDVPHEMDPKDTIAREPLKCSYSSGIHVYDPDTGRIENPSEFPAICKDPKQPFVPFKFSQK
jgi:hypothetical protein